MPPGEIQSIAVPRRKIPFPIPKPNPPLPSGEFHPRRDLGHSHDLVQRDVGIVRWFIQDVMGLNFKFPVRIVSALSFEKKKLGRSLSIFLTALGAHLSPF